MFQWREGIKTERSGVTLVTEEHPEPSAWRNYGAHHGTSLLPHRIKQIFHYLDIHFS